MSKKLKILIVFLILVLGIIVTGTISHAETMINGAGGRVDLDENTKVDLSYRVLRLNKNIYCVEYGVPFDKGSMTFNRSKEYKVKDPVFNYILGKFEDVPKEMDDLKYRKTCLKQNLIWYYITNKDTEDSRFIKDKGGFDNSTKNDIWPKYVDCANLDTELEGKKIKEWIDEATNYAENVKKYGIKIDSITPDNGYININVDGTFDSYDVMFNNDNMGNFTAKNVSIEIPEGITTPSITVKVVAKQKRYNASIYVLYRKTAQKLICIKSKTTSDAESKSDTKTVQLKVDVSLQKYITKVNGKNLTNESTEPVNRINQKTYENDNNSNHNINVNPNLNAETGEYYKRQNPVKIEVGDKVTYRVWVYNNSNYDATSVIVKDTMPYTKENEKIVSLVKIDSIYNKDGNKVEWSSDTNPDNKNTYVYTINNLKAGKSTYFDITLKYTKQVKSIIVNTAWISKTTPNNDTEYRTLDRDYVQMKEYEVSLEKYISNVNSGVTEFNDYINVLTYLRNNTGETVSKLIESYKEIQDYKKYDLNNDGVVNTLDLEIIKTAQFTEVTKDDINNYINADLNSDGIVDQEDIDIYISVKSDLNNDKQLNDSDRYMYILKSLYDGNYLNVDTLNYLYVQRLLIRENKTIADAEQEIDNYIESYNQSDVNDDGYITDEDNYVIQNNKIKIKENEKYKEYDLKQPTDLIENLTESDISTLKEYINNYDLNGDSILNNSDIAILNQYKNDTIGVINKINDFEKLKELKKDFIAKYTIVNNNNNNNENNPYINYEAYNANNDMQVDFEDYIILEQMYEDAKKELENLQKNGYGNIDEEELKNLQNNIDKDGDGNVDEEELKNFQNNIDINGDGNVDEQDSKEINEIMYQLISLNNEINAYKTLLDEFPLGGSIDDGEPGQYDINEDKEVDYKDYLILKKCSVVELNSNEDLNLQTIIDNYNIFDKDSSNPDFSNPDFSEDDINAIKVYKGWKQYTNENIEISAEYDLNHDSIIDQSDKEFIANNKTKPNNNDIDNILNIDDIENFVLLFEENIDKLDYIGNIQIDSNVISDYDKLKQYITELQESISNTKIDIDLKEIKTQQDKDWSKLDINNDGKVNELDLESLDIINNNMQILNLNKEMIRENDFDGDGDWDQNDIDLANEIKDIKNNNIDPVDLQNKIVAKLNEENTNNELKDRPGKAEYLTETNNGYVDNTGTDNEWTQNNYWKYKKVVDVKNGEEVTYTIKVTNDSEDTSVYITEITDYLPDGVKYADIGYNGKQYNTTTDNVVKFDDLAGILLAPGKSASFTVTVEVIEPNMSINILKNTATISEMQNKNKVNVEDSTPNNNTDSDYIQLKGIEQDPGPGPKPDPNTSAYIKGFVWNDIASNKTSDNYDGKYNNDNETKLGGIVVKLFRYGSSTNPVATTTTSTDVNEKGYYLFQDSTLTANKDKEPKDYVDFIKGSKTSGTKRWESYYSYYVEFEYDGVKYTSARDKNGNNIYKAVNSDDDKTNNYSKGSYSENGAWSNACEELYANTNKSREEFNKKFATINNGSGIEYNTINEDGFIPQSIHKYNSTNMTMQSSTELISMENYKDLNYLYDTPLEHVNLGLRGRDIFDLELTSDVDNIKVTVNNQQGVYKYSNKVTLRKSDLTASSTTNEDMANIKRETSNIYVDRQDQNIRTSDLNVANAGTNGTAYGDNQIISDIEVTYKITVHNASRTAGTATKITNYYDSKYDYKGVILGKNCDEIKNVENGTSGSGYNSKIITVNGKMLGQSETMEIYVVYTLKNPAETLKKLKAGQSLPTFNMAEIVEYKTYATSAENEYTRGLLDKDSEPGSASIEKVRTKETGNEDPKEYKPLTTVQYYFSKKNNSSVDLSILKYEDDTYATPTLYFVADESKRTITGTVFEDYTKLINKDGEDQLIRVKTGDGKQDKKYNIEPGIKGATVELYEIVEEPVLRYTAKTDENGNFTIEGFLPGNYIIKYHYGNTNDTFLLDNNPNTKSYNGEDFQSTNNTGSHGSNKLRYDDLGDEKEFWYAYNKSEGISTATDIVERRQQVSTNVTGFDDDQMTVLNNARDGKNANDAKVNDTTVDSIREATKMQAQTNQMLLTVEETVLSNDSLIQKDSFSEYKVRNMNFGIAEVPVTTIDLQKHVYSFKITDSTGKNTLAALERDLTNTAVTVNPSKIATNRLSTVIKVLSEKLNLKVADVEEMINYNTRKNINENVSIKTGLNEEEINNLKDAITNYSLAREIQIVQAWRVTSGNVIAAPGAEVLDVSIEDEKLQGAKLEVTYEITATISAEKNFNNDAVTVPSIKGIVDYIDNNLSYNENSQTKDKVNKDIWSIAKQSEVKFGEEGTPYGERFGTLDPEGKLYNTILSINSKNNSKNNLLLERCGTGKSYVTLEKVLSSNDTTIQDIIMNNVEIYEYKNSVEITSLDYTNQQETGDGSEGENTEDAFIYRDRIRTADRYIILAGRQHDSATSETITIHPPTGDSSINIIYYVIAAVSLVIIAVGVFGIKKFVLTNRKS